MTLETRLTDWLKLIGAAAALIGAVFSGWLWFDERYAQAADLRAMQSEQRAQFSKLDRERERSLDMYRKEQLENKLFELQLIPPNKQTDAQRALILRYNAQLEDVSRRLRAYSLPPSSPAAAPAAGSNN